MGDIKKQKKKYRTPSHPWKKERIDAENTIQNEYGLSNKREIWKANTMLSNFKQQAKRYSAGTTLQTEKQRRELLARLSAAGLLKEGASLDDVLGLRVEDILNRRLQTIVFKRGLAKTIKQARQFIVHGHVTLKGRRVTVPSYTVKKNEEDALGTRGIQIQETPAART